MVELSSIVGGIQAVDQGLRIIKLLRDADFQLEKSDLKLQMADLMSALADAKIGLTNSQSRIGELEQEIARLNAFSERKIKNISSMYVEINEKDEVIDGAYCSRCYDVDRQFVRIVENSEGVRGWGNCPQCKAKYPLYEVELILPKDQRP